MSTQEKKKRTNVDRSDISTGSVTGIRSISPVDSGTTTTNTMGPVVPVDVFSTAVQNAKNTGTLQLRTSEADASGPEKPGKPVRGTPSLGTSDSALPKDILTAEDLLSKRIKYKISSTRKATWKRPSGAEIVTNTTVETIIAAIRLNWDFKSLT
jgi:hypothetical protein